jgi:hypothetical protein
MKLARRVLRSNSPFFLGLLLLLGGCVSAPAPKDYARSSPEAYFTDDATMTVPMKELDRSLTRTYWDDEEGYRIEVIPITGMLLDQMVQLDSVRLRLTDEETASLSKFLKDEYVRRQTCFDVFLSSRVTHLKFYKFIYQNTASHSLVSEGQPTAAPALQELRDRFLPTGRNQFPGTEVFAEYAREFVCGKPIALRESFDFSVKPNWNPALFANTLSWSLTKAAE